MCVWLWGCHSEGVTLADVTLQGITLEGITLEGVTLEGVTQQGVTREDVTIEGVTLEGVTLGCVVSVVLLYFADWRVGVTLGTVTREGVALRWGNLTFHGVPLVHWWFLDPHVRVRLSAGGV